MRPEPVSPPPQESWRLFERIASRYDAVNRMLSLGMDLSWRRRLAGKVKGLPGGRILDVATGTGDVLREISRCCGAVPVKLYGLDRAESMLRLAREKSRRFSCRHVAFLKADALRLPFPSDIFDAVTLGFGIRNMPDPPGVLREITRVLKPGSRVFILEFSLPTNIFIRQAALLYLRVAVPVIGGFFSGHIKAYRYLTRSVEHFPYGDGFCQWLRQVGFSDIRTDSVLWGMASIYSAQKPVALP